jgi:hypothetical protein
MRCCCRRSRAWPMFRESLPDRNLHLVYLTYPVCRAKFVKRSRANLGTLGTWASLEPIANVELFGEDCCCSLAQLIKWRTSN